MSLRFIPQSAIQNPHYLHICPSASTIDIFAERRAGMKAATKDNVAMKITLRARAGQMRSTLSGTGFDDAGGIYVGWVVMMML
jgi:hypothetical protein